MRAARTRSALPAACLCLLLACSPPAASPAGSTPAPPDRALPDTLYGVTLDDLTGLPALVASLTALPQRPTSRIVFDAGADPADYTEAVAALHPVSYLMGLPVDSSAVAGTSLTEYHDRTAGLLAAFGGRIDLWEVGNEVNGGWLGPAEEVTAKVTDAYRQVVAAGGRTALTLYYNPGCAEDPEHEMLPWARAELPQELRDGLDHLLVSYYEDECDGYRPPLAEWDSVFTELAGLFPHARVGFGENGLADRRAAAEQKAEQLTHYYTLPVTAPRYLGGHFWWYYAEDMLPYPPANSLWTALARAITPPDGTPHTQGPER
ncbi:hypothetical protein ACIA8O_32500 [Kitasatospora sp. NPDC051853]|uniref:hypothetical protein n=1 Tax=Kitasatospora sp. NPDC051853 TaxID=3364058 RepID=UPI00379FC01B